MKCLGLLLLLLVLPFIAGCGHKEVRAKVPPPPQLPPANAPSVSPETQTAESANSHSEAEQPTAKTELPPVELNQKPLYSELGIASWYGPPYHNRRAANGEIYDMNQMTAAHRTLPMNSILRVTNVKTGNSAIVRITDRGPFIGERMLDLSLAAAKAVDVWSAGLAWVKIEVLETPAPIDTGGKWAIQIGAFDTVEAATQMKQSLMNRYASTHVLEFPGPTGEWVRIRVPNDDREMAEQISRSITTPEGGVFLVRLD
jgi:rare lipoprotein A